jgi:CheY-like chemotaxis protein
MPHCGGVKLALDSGRAEKMQQFPGVLSRRASGTSIALIQTAMTPYSNARYTVLVVDDDPSVLATYRRLIDRSGYVCRSTDDPAAVLEDESLARDVDLILLDYKMPGMDGLTLLCELRRREVRARCILISAFLNDEVRHRARMLGVERILDKPVDLSTMRKTLSDMLPVTGNAPARIGA